jgi:uncharacterized protein YcnI
MMRKLIMAIAFLALVDTSAAVAQTARSPNEAPVGHRQPRADQVPSEKNLMNPNDPVNRENAELDRKIKGICRGC